MTTDRPGRRPALAERLTRAAAAESYLVLLVCAAAGLMLLGIGLFVMSDTWLALVAGRVVAQGGPPSTDTLTEWARGREWIDQQWLGQLLLYEIWRAGGLVLLGLVHVALVTSAFVLTLIGARRRGGSTRDVALVGLLAALPIGLVTGNIRPQTFAIALFVLVLWLLCEDSRRPSARVFWSFPLLVLWANIHGSVVLGGGLVALAGAIAVARGLRTRNSREAIHGAALAGTVAVALLSTPYHLSLISYLGVVFGNSEIADLAPEWMPPAPGPVHAPFYLLAGLTLILIGRDRRHLTTFEQLALVLLLAGSLSAVRHLAWFALAALLLMPALLTRGRKSDDGSRPRPGLAAAVSAGAVVAVGIAAVNGLNDVARHVESRYPEAAAATVARATERDRSLRVFSHARYADWLLFRHPQLAGRVAFDIRYELLTPSELRRFRRVRHQIGADWLDAARGARLIVLDSSEKPLDALPPTSAVLLREPEARQLYGARDVAVILRPPEAARQR